MTVMIRTLLMLGLLVGAAIPALAEPLVTKEEAALPPAKGAFSLSQRGITRGPKIIFVAQTGELRSPTAFAVKFETYGGASIDLDTVKVVYLRAPLVDVTPRLKPFMLPTGIMMPNAELPPGEHAFRVDAADTGGRTGSANAVLKIAP